MELRSTAPITIHSCPWPLSAKILLEEQEKEELHQDIGRAVPNVLPKVQKHGRGNFLCAVFIFEALLWFRGSQHHIIIVAVVVAYAHLDETR